ncbi:MAG: enoyl-CoA hydratase-related protein, partial [Rhodospirillales bacterium]|nr:enoyl-CoA hydratase-related protein [Rhodospirillales bacterium]
MAGVTTEIRGIEGQSVAWITVDRPEKMNALNSALIAKLTSAIEGLMDNGDLRAVVLTGKGEKAFIGGADISEMADLTPETAETFITGLHGASAA